MSTPDDEQREAEFEEWNERTAGGTKPTPQAPHISEVDEQLREILGDEDWKYTEKPAQRGTNK